MARLIDLYTGKSSKDVSFDTYYIGASSKNHGVSGDKFRGCQRRDTMGSALCQRGKASRRTT